MKKIVIITGVLILVSLSALVFAETSADKSVGFNDTVYRGEKWEFDFGIPKNEAMIILPQDRENPKAYEGYVERASEETEKYSIILLDK